MRRTQGWFFCLLLLGIPLQALPVVAQSTNEKSNAKALVYEVVSVRPSKEDDGMRVSTETNRLSMGNITLLGMLFNAFPIRPHDVIPGLPSWGRTDQFDVEAKMEDELAAELQKLPREASYSKRKLMLQALLADRFKLRFHYETRERPIYSLQVEKSGFKLKEVAEKDAGHGSSWSDDRIEVHGGTTQNLAYCLSDVMGRMVRDDTGLTGQYDMQLRWTPEDRQGAGEEGPTIFTALQEQLGLRLVSAKGSVQILIIDHVEKPSEN